MNPSHPLVQFSLHAEQQGDHRRRADRQHHVATAGQRAQAIGHHGGDGAGDAEGAGGRGRTAEGHGEQHRHAGQADGERQRGRGIELEQPAEQPDQREGAQARDAPALGAIAVLPTALQPDQQAHGQGRAQACGRVDQVHGFSGHSAGQGRWWRACGSRFE